LTKNFVKANLTVLLDVEPIEDPAAATVALAPLRRRILAELREPGSAATLAVRLGLPRQKLNYHLRALEAHGLVEVAGERKHGGLTERLLVATAASYVISPAALGANAPDPGHVRDRLSVRYLLALAARLVGEVGALARRAEASRSRVAPLGIDTEIGFDTPEDRARFADDLTNAVTRLAAKYHHDGGRPHRLVVAAHPIPRKEES
jgi:DNA-binding transcriptional ArsR family regulator